MHVDALISNTKTPAKAMKGLPWTCLNVPQKDSPSFCLIQVAGIQGDGPIAVGLLKCSTLGVGDAIRIHFWIPATGRVGRVKCGKHNEKRWNGNLKQQISSVALRCLLYPLLHNKNMLTFSSFFVETCETCSIRPGLGKAREAVFNVTSFRQVCTAAGGATRAWEVEHLLIDALQLSWNSSLEVLNLEFLATEQSYKLANVFKEMACAARAKL